MEPSWIHEFSIHGIFFGQIKKSKCLSITKTAKWYDYFLSRNIDNSVKWTEFVIRLTKWKNLIANVKTHTILLWIAKISKKSLFLPFFLFLFSFGSQNNIIWFANTKSMTDQSFKYEICYVSWKSIIAWVCCCHFFPSNRKFVQRHMYNKSQIHIVLCIDIAKKIMPINSKQSISTIISAALPQLALSKTARATTNKNVAISCFFCRFMSKDQS